MNVKKVIIILFLIVSIYVLVFSPCGLVKIISIRLNIWKVQDEINILKAKEIVLERETKLLESDPEYIKRAIREKLGIE
ncbi:MAG: septum formation initiator family protein [bacterium]|nr:septum formation initiator family protein [bacterium]